MLFNSFEFIFLFFPIVFVLLFFVVPKNMKMATLLSSSYFFYGYWNYKFIPIILLSTYCDFFIGKKLCAQTSNMKKKLLLGVSIGVNLGLLGIFKYLNSGGIVGYVKDLKEALNKILDYERSFPSDINFTHQLAWQWYFLYDQRDQMTIDYDCHLWQTLGGKQNLDKIMRKTGDRYVNTLTGSTPCFIHGAGSIGLRAMEKLLRIKK